MRSKFKWIFTLVLALTVQLSFAQGKTVTGTVSDASGPLPGANVVVKETKAGVQTDVDGKYSIQVATGQTLVFSFIGMTDREVKVGASTVVNARLDEGSVTLGEVVVTGALGIKRPANAVTSSFGQVNNQQLTQASNPSAVQSLVGKVSGLQINATSSSVEGTNKIVLRGARSISGSNEALVVIDGAISSTTVLNQLPPELIENVNVMKGAQGAALYGSDGSNGVIIVTTRRGSGGDKIQIQVNSSFDIQEVAYVPQRQLRYGQGWDGNHSIQENGSWGPEFDGTLQPTGLPQADGSYIVRPYTGIKDNIKQFFKQGNIYQNSVTLSGGNLEEGYITFSANRNQTDFIVEGDQLKRNTFLLKSGKKMGRFTIEGNMTYLTQKVEQTGSDLYGNLLQTPSNVPVRRFSHGNNDQNWTVYYRNPYWSLQNDREFNRTERFIGIATLGYEFNKNINVSYLANLRMHNFDNTSYVNEYNDLAAPVYGSSDRSVQSSFLTSQQFQRLFYGDLLINFDYELSKDFNLRANLGNNIQDTYIKINSVGGTNLEIPGVYNFNNVLNPYTASQLTNQYTRNRKTGVFANVDLDFRNYLFLNVTARNDWSSVFAEENRSFFYPSAGLSFIATNAFPSIKGDVLNYAKVIANWTKVGRDPVAPYAVQNVGVLGIGYPFTDANSYVQQTRITDPNIEPEFVTSKEIGASFGFFNDRITLDGSFYITDTDNLVTSSTSSSASGVTNIRLNVGNLQTKGFEIDLGLRPLWSKEADGLRLEIRPNFTYYRTEITKINADADEVSLRQPYDWIGVFAVKGQDFPMLKGTTYARDDQGRIIVDESGNPTIDPEFKNLGRVTPDYIVGLNSSISYKGFKLAATMDYRKGGKFYSDVKRNLAWTGQLVETAANGRDGFVMPNSSYYDAGSDSYLPNTNILTGGGSYTNFINYYNSYYQTTGENLVLDATAFKLREVALSYAIPSKFLDKTGIQSMSLGVHARNILTYFPKQNRFYSDPEASEGAVTNADGLSFTDRYPAQQTYGASLNITF